MCHNNIIDLPKLSILSIGDTSFGNSTILQLSNLPQLQSLNISNHCFEPLLTFTLNGLTSLTSLSIGSNSFTEKKYSYGNDSNKSFHILNCNKLESISIGKYSFSDYGGEFELSNLPQLQSIVIGELDSDSYNFYSSSLIIQSIELIYWRIINIIDLPKLQSVILGDYSFCESFHTTFKGYYYCI